jgi:hypothetical protein
MVDLAEPTTQADARLTHTHTQTRYEQGTKVQVLHSW